MGQEMTPAQLERIKQQRAQRFKEMGLPASAGQIADIPVENMPEQRAYQAPIQAPVQTIEETYQPQYEAPQQVYRAETPEEHNISEQIRNQIAEERSMRQAAMYTAPRDKFNALEAIRRGAKKQEFNSFIKVETSGVNGNQLPEPKVGKRRPMRPGQQQEVSANAVQVKTYEVRKSAEAEQLESLFTDKAPGINVRSSGAPQGTLIDVDENYSNIGPTFDPVAHLKQKASEKGINLDLSQRRQVLNENGTPQVFQTSNNGQLEHLMLMMETMMKNQQNNNAYNPSSLKETIEKISKKVAEDTIKRVLKEYAETQKGKKTFEVVNARQNVVKIGGEYFQLKKVTPKS